MPTFSRSATATWNGDVARGDGEVTAASRAFAVAMTFPRLNGEPPGATTPEELLAASHANCYAIALRSVLAQHRGSAQRVSVTATLTADKGKGAIRLVSSHLEATVEGLQAIDSHRLDEVARIAKDACTISTALRGTVDITMRVTAI
jgi:osmotically inducible protein OsmC